jgi:hypothetical protein
VSDIREDGTGMALRAGNALVHPLQREMRPAMIEFGDIADRLPSRKRVAVLAGEVQRTMRTACGFHLAGLVLRCLGLLPRKYGSKEHERRSSDEHNCQAICNRRSQVFRLFFLFRLQTATSH